jgi:hypothetical protein
VRLGQVIRRLKQLWPAGCVTAALLHDNPDLGASVDGEQPLAAAAAAADPRGPPAEGEPDAEATQRRWVGGPVVGLFSGLVRG